jgi:hypothetical protein
MYRTLSHPGAPCAACTPSALHAVRYRIKLVKIPTQSYLQQDATWPTAGQHILAHFDDASVIVYQAYRPAIGHFAAQHGYFGGDFSLSRMSWFKPNFLWMMYRSGWGTKEGQEVTLAIRIKRSFFEAVLEQAVASSFGASSFENNEAWKRALASSNVRLQWDPDHAPCGAPVQRRAIQLGLRGQVLEEYSREAIIEIEDISSFVAEQRPNAQPGSYENLITPLEQIYVPAKPEIATRLKLSATE